jgi:signal transduction histidine kinase
MQMRNYFIVIMILANSLFLQAQNVVLLNDSQEVYTLDNQLQILRKQNIEIAFDEINAGKYNNNFKPLRPEDENYDFNEFHSKWLKINLNNQSNATNWVLAFYNPFEKLTYYLIAPDGKIEKKVSGYTVPFKNLDIPELRATFFINLIQKGNYTIFMQFDKSYNRHLQVNLFSQKAYLQERQEVNILLGIYFGICLIVLIYNLLFYFVTKDSVYILYVFYVIFFLMTHLSFSDLGYNLFWNNYPVFGKKSLFLSLIFSNSFGFLFFLKAYNVPSKSRFGIFIYLMFLLYFIYFILLLLSPTTSEFVSFSISILTLLNFIILYSISVFYTFRKQGSSIFYFTALTVLFVGFLIYELYDFNVIPYSLIAKYAVPISSMMEILILSIGLSDTWRRARNEQRKAEKELIRSLQEKDRLRGDIARNLHDEVGATLSSISFMSEVGNIESKKSKTAHNQEITNVLNTIGENSRDMLEKLDDIVWMVNPRNDSLDNIILRMKKYTIEILAAKNIEYKLDFPNELPNINLSMEIRRNLYLIFKEAVNNLAKYSESKKAFTQLQIEGQLLKITVQDWGKGFDMQTIKKGDGINNMTERAKEIDADFRINSKINEGTTILLSLKIP